MKTVTPSETVRVRLLCPPPNIRKADRAVRCRVANPRPAPRLRRFDSFAFRHHFGSVCKRLKQTVCKTVPDRVTSLVRIQPGPPPSLYALQVRPILTKIALHPRGRLVIPEPFICPESLSGQLSSLLEIRRDTARPDRPQPKCSEFSCSVFSNLPRRYAAGVWMEETWAEAHSNWYYLPKFLRSRRPSHRTLQLGPRRAASKCPSSE